MGQLKSAFNLRLTPPKIIRSNRGMSIMEVLVALGMVGILVVVLSSVIETMQKSQKQTNVVATIENIRNQITRAVLDQQSWLNTVNFAGNIELTCLRTNSACDPTAATFGGAPTSNQVLAEPAANVVDILQLMDASPGGGNVIVNSAPGQGFTETGAPCAGFDAAAGNNQCPLRFDVRFEYMCGSKPPPCVNPAVVAHAVVQYAPDNNNPQRLVVNPDKYRVRIVRGEGNAYVSESISIAYKTPPTANGGSCGTPGDWIRVPLNSQEVDAAEATAPPGNVVDAGGGNWSFLAGTYNCSATASCFACGTLRVRIVQAGAPSVSSPAALAPEWVSAQAVLSGHTLVLNSTTTIWIEQSCGQTPPVNPDWGMGIAVPTIYNSANPPASTYGADQVYARLNCVRVQ